jgi:nitrate/nitrite transporter NarK
LETSGSAIQDHKPNKSLALSCVAPYIGYVADKLGPARGMGWAFSICAVAFLLAMIMASQLPETKGKELE